MYHIRSNGTMGICRATNGNCPYIEHFETAEEAQNYIDEFYGDKSEEALKKRLKFLKKIQQEGIKALKKEEEYLMQRIDEDIAYHKELAEEERKITENYSRNWIRFLKTQDNKIIEDPEEYLFGNTSLKRKPDLQKDIARYIEESRTSDPEYREWIKSISDGNYPLMFTRNPEFTQNALKERELMQFPHYANNPRIRERDLKIYNERLPGYTRYHSERIINERVDKENERSRAKFLAILENIKETKDFAQIPRNRAKGIKGYGEDRYGGLKEQGMRVAINREKMYYQLRAIHELEEELKDE